MARRKERARAWVRVSHRTKDLPASRRRWEVVYEDPRQGFKRRTQGGFSSKKAAEDWRDEFTKDTRAGSWVDPARGDVTVKAVGEAWLETYVSKSGKSRGKAQHAQIVNGKRSLLMTEFGETRIGDLTPGMVGVWINKLVAMGRSSSTIRHNFYTLRLICRYALGQGRIASDPTATVEVPRPRSMVEQEADRYALSEDEVHAIIAAVPEPWNVYLRLLAATGMRPEEATALQLRDLDDDASVIRVRRVLVKHGGKLVIEEALKTSRSRRDIDLDPQTASLLVAYVREHTARATKWFKTHPGHEHPGDALPLFVGVGEFKRGQRQRKTGSDLDWLDYSRPMSHGWFHMRYWDAACEAADLPANVRPYDLRHFHASWHVARLGQENALTITEISERLGHASTSMTLNRYAHSPKDRAEHRRAALAQMWATPANVQPIRRKGA